MSSSDPPSKLPVAPNMSSILARISLSLAKHERILSTLNRPSPSTTSKSATSGFSSLSAGGGKVAVQSTKRDVESDFALDRALPPNAGIGYEPSAAEKGGAKGREEDRVLRGRLLGRNGRGGKEKDGNGKRGYVSESEEEEGRSGLGRGKKKRRTGAVRRVEGEDMAPGDVAMGEIPMGGDIEVRDVDGDAAAGEEKSGAVEVTKVFDSEDIDESSATPVNGNEVDTLTPSDAKKRRRREKKKRRKERDIKAKTRELSEPLPSHSS